MPTNKYAAHVAGLAAAETYRYVLLTGISTDWMTAATVRGMDYVEDVAADEMSGYTRPLVPSVTVEEDDANDRAELHADQASIANLSANTFDGCSIDEADTTLTASAGGTFAATDVGKIVRVPGAGAAGADLYSRIASYTSGTEVELADAAGTTVADVDVAIAVAGIAIACEVTDDTDSPLVECYDIRPANGSEDQAYFPSGAAFQVSDGADGFFQFPTSA